MYRRKNPAFSAEVFDIGRLNPYDCRPMFEDMLPVKAEYRKLAQKSASFTKVLAVSSLPRLFDAVLPTDNKVEVHLEFDQNHKYQVVVTGSLKTEVALACQRCLNPMAVPIETEVKLVIVKEEQVDEVDGTFDAFLVNDEWVDLNEIVQEELLLALPFVSYHDDDVCNQASLSSSDETVDTQKEMSVSKQNPFHVLSSLKESNKE